jgi:hypothetical protein
MTAKLTKLFVSFKTNPETGGLNSPKNATASEEKQQQKEAGMRPERKDAHRPYWR